MKKRSSIKKLFFVIFIAMLLTTVKGQGFAVKKISLNHFAHSNIAPFVSDSTLIFASNQRLSLFKNYFNTDGEYIYRLFKSNITNGLPIEKSLPFMANETGKLNVGSVTISGDCKLLIVCQNGSDDIKNINGNRGNTYALYFSEKNASGNWSRLKALSLNTKKLYNVIHPSLSQDGTQLAFASDAAEGLGKFDLYISQKVAGVWQEPKNLGNLINTAESELFPSFIGNKKLSFSSNGHNGKGGMDIFITENKNGWTAPKALEEPINCSSNDFSSFFNKDEQTGYFSSDRSGKDEIFHFERTFPTFEDVQPQVIDTFCFSLEENSIASDSTQGAVTYQWNFGDGSTAEGLAVDHCFAGPGQYKVILNVLDSITKQELSSVANYDLDLNYTQQVFISCPDTVKIGQQVTINATKSKLGTIIAQDYFWIIENKEKRIGEEVQYTFNKKGIFTILCGVISRENPNERMASTRLIIVE